LIPFAFRTNSSTNSGIKMLLRWKRYPEAEDCILQVPIQRGVTHSSHYIHWQRKWLTSFVSLKFPHSKYWCNWFFKEYYNMKVNRCALLLFRTVLKYILHTKRIPECHGD
jgi:hypothetical protein